MSPWHGTLIAPSTQLVPPCLLPVLHHHLQHLIVASDAVVLVVTTQLQAQHFILFQQVFMPMVPAPLPERRRRTTKPLLSLFPLDNPIHPARLGPEVGKPEKVECARLLEPNQRRLRRVYGQLEALKPLRQRRQHPLFIREAGFGMAFEALPP